MDPHIIQLKDGTILMTIRNQLGRIYQAISTDQGSTWTHVDSTDIQTADSPIALRRVPETEDLLMIWNNSREIRRPLSSAISKNEGEDWTHFKDIETSKEYSYSHPTITFKGNDTLLMYNQYDEKKGWVSVKLKKFPINWFYSV